ncbi:MAG: NYN domain-containing protein, partial [Clostridiales bacterium]|nr:NYN domain-containing protein [Clostridiales bacterium]
MDITGTGQISSHICIGLVAHVDAGKTTLSEALLYQTGAIRLLGRVDHQDTYLDNDVQERERGITIFSKQARITDDGWSATLLDTPGHVDFSAEMERTLQVLDYAVLVISGSDGVQAHTRTLWKLLRHYEVPVFLFINKMDLPGADREQLMTELKSELSDACVDFNTKSFEDLAVCSETMLDAYMEDGTIPVGMIRDAISRRLVYPCYFGSALKGQGVEELLAGLKLYTQGRTYQESFAARVYKIGRDARGERLTYLKVTGGTLSVKDSVEYSMSGASGTDGVTDDEVQEKIEQIRLYSGEKYEAVNSVCAGEVCAVTGLSRTYPGQGIGAEKGRNTAVLEPVLTYQIFLPKEVSPIEMSRKLKQLEEEDPQLHVVWDEQLQELHIQMMGQVQIEVLTRQILERFGVAVVFGPGNIVYKETIAKPVEGIGHFEPLRHYAEVHILLEPGEPGSGIQAASACSTDLLDANWQRLIATHILEKEHRGVLTGSTLTDVKCTILAGRAHPKHTEGGDFRKATYRAIRQGLKCTESVLLEPYYSFILEIPMEDVGRAMTDLERLAAKFGAPEQTDMVRITGRGPVSTLQPYIAEVHAYTHGLGSLSVELDGYDVCHNSEEVIAAKGYDSEADLKNPTSSVFCAHGSGFVVPWDEVDRYMHLERAYHPDRKTGEDASHGYGGALPQDGFSYDFSGQSFGPDISRPGRSSWEKSVAAMSETELDAELADVYAREFGMSKEDMEDAARRKWKKDRAKESRPKGPTVKYDQKGNPIYPKKKPREEYLIVDGYNVIFAWEDLKDLARVNIDAARDRLK